LNFPDELVNTNNMGKTYIDTVKYLVRARFEVGGIIEKPDIVGAIFGQTEGLLGDELDLRELQKNGRIGRIEVDTQTRGQRTLGAITMSSSLDMVETSILAAALEVVDRVGPHEAKIIIDKIEDSRNSKRKAVLERAKNLLKTMMTDEIPESKELTELVRENTNIVSYGADKLPAGPAIDSSDEIVVVEGRADVLNLLKNDVKNVIAVGGANVGKTIADLCKQKEVTVFLDGDRGGDIILRELANVTDIDFVARAPPGLEVEELQRKELIKCLRRRIPFEQAMEEFKRTGQQGRDNYDRREGREDANERRERYDTAPAREPRGRDERDSRDAPRERAPMRSVRVDNADRSEVRERPTAVLVQDVPSAPAARPAADEAPALSAEDSEHATKVREHLKALDGSLKARVLDAGYQVTAEVPIREIMKAVSEANVVHAVVLDGIVTQRLIDLAESKAAKYVGGLRVGTLTRQPESLKIILAQ
jgi:DNA primase